MTALVLRIVLSEVCKAYSRKYKERSLQRLQTVHVKISPPVMGALNLLALCPHLRSAPRSIREPSLLRPSVSGNPPSPSSGQRHPRPSPFRSRPRARAPGPALRLNANLHLDTPCAPAPPTPTAARPGAGRRSPLLPRRRTLSRTPRRKTPRPRQREDGGVHSGRDGRRHGGCGGTPAGT